MNNFLEMIVNFLIILLFLLVLINRFIKKEYKYKKLFNYLIKILTIIFIFVLLIGAYSIYIKYPI